MGLWEARKVRRASHDGHSHQLISWVDHEHETLHFSRKVRPEITIRGPINWAIFLCGSAIRLVPKPIQSSTAPDRSRMVPMAVKIHLPS